MRRKISRVMGSGMSRVRCDNLRTRAAAAGVWIAVAAGLVAATAATEPRYVLPPPNDPAWESLELPNVARPSEYHPVKEGDGWVLEASADCGSSALAIAVPEVDLSATPVLRWRWWAEQLPQDTDELTREGDDFAGRVSVMFAFEPERASWLDRVAHELTGRVVGREMPASALHFLWTARIAPGTVWDNPRTDRAKNWALEQGPTSGWRDAEVDVAKAYRHAFDREAPPLLAVGVMTDGDDHCGSVRGRYADFRFGTRRSGPDPADPDARRGIEAAASPAADTKRREDR